jgi:hypothetical protein
MEKEKPQTIIEYVRVCSFDPDIVLTEREKKFKEEMLKTLRGWLGTDKNARKSNK